MAFVYIYDRDPPPNGHDLLNLKPFSCSIHIHINNSAILKLPSHSIDHFRHNGYPVRILQTCDIWVHANAA